MVRTAAIRTPRPRSLAIGVGGVVLATVVLTACGGSSDKGSAPPRTASASTAGAHQAHPAARELPSRDACALLTPAVAATAIGEQVEPASSSPPQKNGPVTISRCSYAGKNSGRTISLMLRNETGSASSIAGSIETMKTVTYEGENTENVPSLGDAALAAGSQLNVFSGDEYLLLSGADTAHLVAAARHMLQ